MKIKNRIQKLEQCMLQESKCLGIFVETINGEITINEEKSNPDALRQLYHDINLVYGNKNPKERN